VRVALGATPAAVLSMVAGESARLWGPGWRLASPGRRWPFVRSPCPGSGSAPHRRGELRRGKAIALSLVAGAGNGGAHAARLGASTLPWLCGTNEAAFPCPGGRHPTAVDMPIWAARPKRNVGEAIRMNTRLDWWYLMTTTRDRICAEIMAFAAPALELRHLSCHGSAHRQITLDVVVTERTGGRPPTAGLHALWGHKQPQRSR